MFKQIQHLLTPNQYSRPGLKLMTVRGVVVHWTANPKTSALANRVFYESRKTGQQGYGSVHFIIDLNGDVIQCIPEDEMAYHVGADQYSVRAKLQLGRYPNDCTLGIACTHLDWQGKMSPETNASLVELTANLIKKYDLDYIQDIYLHADITDKACHKWFVDHPDQWLVFKQKVFNVLQQ